MLTRIQQQLLADAGASMAASALLDQLRSLDTLLGGRSSHDGWISYNRKAIWREDHGAFWEAVAASGGDHTAVPRTKPRIPVKVTWAEAAEHGMSLPATLRAELTEIKRTSRTEELAFRDFSDERGGWPWRRRFESDEAHATAQAEWDERYAKHIEIHRDVTDRLNDAVARALPLTTDDEPVDLLELLDAQRVPSTSAPGRSVLQAAALTTPRKQPASDTLPCAAEPVETVQNHR